MGAEALSKVQRRDIRRAFAPEASAEIFRFVDHTEKALEDRCIGMERAVETRVTDWTMTIAGAQRTVVERLDALESKFSSLTFRQRVRWLLRGVWP